MTAATVETKIKQALKARVLTLPSPVDYDVAWPGAEFERPSTNGMPDPYIEVYLNRNPNNRFLIGSTAPQERLGIMGLHLMYPLAPKTSEDVQEQLAGLIASHFPTDYRMTSDDVALRVQRAPDVMAPLRDDAYLRWPVNIRWQSFC